jgi:hypothetical protein
LPCRAHLGAVLGDCAGGARQQVDVLAPAGANSLGELNVDYQLVVPVRSEQLAELGSCRVSCLLERNPDRQQRQL